MTNPSAFRFWAPVILLGAVSLGPIACSAKGQVAQTATQSLLDKAHALEVRGRMDMADQTWQQVLLADPNNTEALGGRARAAKLSGKPKEASEFIEKLRGINPNDPGIARAENMGSAAGNNTQLQQAGKLAQQGQYAQAMAIYRKVYGDNPPQGDQALAYYETEAATEDGRPHAVAGLRLLSEKNPADSRYQIALGRILTYNPKTRPEGRRLLAAHPADPSAMEALRQSLLWDAQNPATAGDIKAYLAHHQDPQLAQALRNEPRIAPQQKQGTRATPPVPQTAEQRAATAAAASRSSEDRVAYAALNAKHLEEAETRFKAILAKTPEDPNALAGMGYVRMQQANFGGALSFLTQAKSSGSKDPGVEPAIATSRFWYTMGEGAIALNENDLPLAEKQYRIALGMRPTSTEALEGLGGTLLRAEQPAAAIPYFVQFTKLKPAASHAWRGLFLAVYGAGDSPKALLIERQIPAAPRAELAKDPLFLRALSSAYSSVGRDADAQRVIKMALDLPFPADARGLEAETQLQYAGLLQQANHLEQAAGLYRQVLAKNQNSTSAWQGLVRTEHAMGKDTEALQTLESMPPASYATAMKEPGFESTVAAVYQNEKRLDVAQDVLEKAIAQQQTAGQKPFVPNQVQLAGLYLQRGNPSAAYPLYQSILTENPDRPDAWKGVLTALHSTGRDQDALAEIQQIPAVTRARMEDDPEFLQVVGGIYTSLGQPQQSQIYLRRVQQHYAAQHVAPPADVDIQNAWLMYNSQQDAGLHRQLLALGDRNDLTDEQRRTVETIWANFAVRRANQDAAAGNNKASLEILNATARSFPDNPGVIKALAGGYSQSGMPKQAVAIWKAQDLKNASAGDYRAAIGAALAANDQKDAETWLRFALDHYPTDPQLLNLGARFEQARGDNSRAADYYRASLKAMPASDPGAELASELRRPVAPSVLPGARSGRDLANLLAPGATTTQTPVETRPYLPSNNSMYGTAPVQLNQPGMSAPMGDTPVVPSYMSNPTPSSKQSPAGSKTRLRDYVPQASADEPLPLDATQLPASAVAANEGKFIPEGSTLILTPAAYQQQQVTRATQQAQSPNQTQQTAPAADPNQPTQTVRPGPLTTQPTSAPQQQGTAKTPAEDVYGPYVPYHAPVVSNTIQLGAKPAERPIVKPEVTDVVPTARYVPNARGRSTTSSHADINAANAAAVRRRQSDPQVDPRTGESKPPAEDFTTTETQSVQYNPAAAAGQVPQPAKQQQTGQQQTGQQPYPQNTQQPGYTPSGGQTQTYPAQPGDSYGQQYPQPRTGARPVVSHNRRPVQRKAAPVAQAPEPQAIPQGLSYPGIAQGLSYQPYPAVGPVYPLGAPPTDYDLMSKRVPPLRGGYYTDLVLPQVPLTERQQTERDLAVLEASYSGWLGGTASARYRSGTVGLDRLTDLETTVEASVTFNNNVRVTVVPKAVFLNSGTLDTTQYAGLTSGVPVLGTLPASAITAPSQQVANGVGGELQVAGRNFAIAGGYTPYEFLVRNFTARGLFRANQHFTFLFNRDAVTETQLSYAGLRDPGSATAVYGGNIWGGVVSTGGGLRFDMGDERAGFYVTADGASLDGYHVLGNNKFEGSAGAYFLAHTFPGYGKLNIGGSIFGMHYAHNERGLTYGQGGYFSPSAYFLASIPVTYAGRYGQNFHYSIAGSLGVQTFQEDDAPFFPLDRGLQSSFASTANGGLPCTAAQTAAHTCAQYPVNSNTGGNYGVNVEGSYRIAEHWFAGGFLSANNTNNYNTVTGGFFIRYLFRPQVGTDEYPTGLLPVEGFRPLRIP